MLAFEAGFQSIMKQAAGMLPRRAIAPRASGIPTPPLASERQARTSKATSVQAPARQSKSLFGSEAGANPAVPETQTGPFGKPRQPQGQISTKARMPIAMGMAQQPLGDPNQTQGNIY